MYLRDGVTLKHVKIPDVSRATREEIEPRSVNGACEFFRIGAFFQSPNFPNSGQTNYLLPFGGCEWMWIVVHESMF